MGISGPFNHTLHREDKSQVVQQQQDTIELVERQEVGTEGSPVAYKKWLRSETQAFELLFFYECVWIVGLQGDGVKVVQKAGLLLR